MAENPAPTTSQNTGNQKEIHARKERAQIPKHGRVSSFPTKVRVRPSLPILFINCVSVEFQNVTECHSHRLEEDPNMHLNTIIIELEVPTIQYVLYMQSSNAFADM